MPDGSQSRQWAPNHPALQSELTLVLTLTLAQIRKLPGHELPRAHTCFNVLDLPPYKKKAQVTPCVSHF